MDSKKVIELLDSIEKKYPELSPYRVYLASLYRGYLVFKKYECVEEMEDVCFCGQETLFSSYNKIMDVVQENNVYVANMIMALIISFVNENMKELS